MTANNTDQQMLQLLRSTFHDDLPHRLNALASYLNHASIDCDCELFAAVRRLIDVFQLLRYRQVEQLNARFIEAEVAYKNQQSLDKIRQLIGAIAGLAHQLTDEDYDNGNSPFAALQKAPINNRTRIYLLVGAKKSAYLMASLDQAVYEVIRLSNTTSIAEQINENAEGVLVIDNDYMAAQGNAIDAFKALKASGTDKLECILVARQADFSKRLNAVRAGINLVIDRYSDCSSLIRAIEQLALKNNLTKKNVLLVCIDPVLSEYISQIIKASGLAVTLISQLDDDHMNVVENQFFDLLVLDYFLGEIYGYEISQVIKRYDHCAHTPVLFLYAGTDINCTEHPELASRQGRVIDVYDAEYLSGKMISTIQDSYDTCKLDRYLTDTLLESKNRRIALDAHCIISMADVSGKITDINSKFCEVSGYSREELIGKDHRIINSGYHDKSFFKDMWETITSGKIWHGEVCNKRKNGELYWVESSIVPFLADTGQPYQYVSVRTEITHIKETEEKLRVSEDRLMRSQWFADIGTWDWNIVSGDLYWSPKIAPLFGYEEGQLETTYENFLNSVHEEDRQSVIDAVTRCVERGEDYDIEHRCVWPGGEVRWMSERGDVVRSEQGEPMHMLGVVQDITDRKKAEIEVERQKNLLGFVKEGLTRFVDEGDFLFVASSILSGLMDITESNYGFTGEIIYDGMRPYLKMHAVNNREWNEEIHDSYYKKCKDGMEIHELDNLVGSVITEKKVIICNDAMQGCEGKAMPEGHPALTNFMGVPVFHGNELVGVYGLGNRKEYYSQQDVNFLKPFNASYSAIIHARHMREMQKDTLILLRESKQVAEQASQAKSQFLASMSHELRTPMNAILGFGQLLGMDVGRSLNDAQRDSVQEILKAGNHLLELINEILDLSKIEAGKIDLDVQALEIANAVHEAVGYVQAQAEKTGINIEYALNGEPCEYSRLNASEIKIFGDSIRLRQVLLNLLSNAVKYNVEGGSIVINIGTHRDDVVRVSIIDTGLGIPVEKQGELFRSFHRLGAESSEIEGTGIGLVITKQIVELMGGQIGFDSKPDMGSTFWVDLLYCEQDVMNDSRGDAGICPDVNGIKNKKVIYIEDNPTNMRLVMQLMSSMERVKLITAHEPHLGIMLIEQYKPDLILLDINLPGMNGIEVMSRLRQMPVISEIPVIAISANAMKSDIRKAKEAGIKEYITKPIDVPSFMTVLSEYL